MGWVGGGLGWRGSDSNISQSSALFGGVAKILLLVWDGVHVCEFSYDRVTGLDRKGMMEGLYIWSGVDTSWFDSQTS